jgi:ABC-2 type transport system ATP-binding protein
MRTYRSDVSRGTITPMTDVIEATALTKFYGSRRGVIDVTFAVTEGEVFGFLGPNGAGKTTTIRLMLGFIRPTSGQIRVAGLDAWSRAPAVHRSVSYVGSDPGYLGELTAASLLAYSAALRGLAPQAWHALAERLELDPKVPIRKLSHGSRRKIGIVQAFMGQEPIVVLDEPSSGLDPLMQREFLVLVAESRKAGRTVFLSSHNLPEVERSCDRVAIIRAGRLEEISGVQQLLSEHWRSVNLVLAEGAPPDAFALPNVQVLAHTGQTVHLMVKGDVNPLLQRIAALRVHDISITTPDVEDIFMRFYEGSAEDRAAELATTAGVDS